MKKLFTFFVLIALFLGAMAQAPQMFSYQAVVRNSSNVLITNQTVGIRISILQGGAFGNAVYVETHTEPTNENGLLIIDVGDGTVQQGSFESINWANGPYFLKSEIDPDGGTDYAVMTIQQLLSVPYSLYAQHAGNGFSGDYNDLTNTPVIPTVPDNVSAFINDAGYLTSFTEQQVLSIRQDTIFLTGGSFVKLPEGFDGDYYSLTNTPTIPTVPTNISVFNNDAGYITNDNLPEIPTVPENVSAFVNDVPYLTTEQQILSISHDTIFLTGGSFVKLPEGFDGDYNSLINKPSIFSGDYNDLTNTPDIPQIPANVSAFSNDAGYITNQDCPTVDVCDLYEIIANLQQRIENLENNGWVNPTPIIPTDTTTPIYNPCDTIGFVNDIDGNIYNTVQIGQQCWLKENLRTTRYADGTVIPMGENTSNDVAYRYAPSNFQNNVQQYGYLYNWQAASRGAESAANPSGVQGICPNGWHLPSDAEWTQLTDYVSSQSQYVCGNNPTFIGKPLAAQTGWYSNSGPCNIGNDLSSNNATHFSAMPAGYYFGSYYRFKQTAYFWSSTSHEDSYAYGRDMTCQESTVNRHTFFKYNAFSVRCVFNGTAAPQPVDTTVTPIDTTVIVPIVPPTVDSTVIGNVTDSTAVVFSELLDDGGDSLVVTGFCWNTTGNPTLADNHTESDDTTMTFSAITPALDTCMTYYVRAYATNSAGTAYGPVSMFSTPCPEPPIDTTVTPIDTTNFECGPFLNIHDTTVNYGASVTLSVTDTSINGVTWTWSGGQSSGDSLTVTPNVTTTYYATVMNLGPELIVNGDFEQGNVGFISEYEYHNYQPEDRVDEGTYTIGTDPGGYVESMLWEHSGDHTTGTGNMMIVDGYDGSGIKTIWSQTITVQPNTQYQFSYWVKSLFPPHPQLSILLNDIPQDDAFAGFTEYNLWTQNSTLWNSGQNSQVIIKIVELTNSGGGNDPCFDDISFRQVSGGAILCSDSVVVNVLPQDTTVTPIDTNTFECHPFLNIHDTTVNWGAQVTLSVTDTTIGNVQWAWPGGSASGNSITVSPVDTTTYYATAIQLGPELIVNGDFEQGNVGFETECHTNYSNNGWYKIDTIVPAHHWAGNDHAFTGNGNFMYFDSYTSNDTATYWGQTVQVIPNTTYSFTVNAITLINPNPHLYVSVNGVDLNENYPSVPNDWTTIQYLWQSDSATSAQIKIYNKNMDYWGNDWALDDISFRAVIDSNVCVDSAVVMVDTVMLGIPCPGIPTVTDIDGNVYHTVQIGNQCWTRENLRTKHYPDGTEIAFGGTDSSSVFGYRYYPNNDSGNVPKFGYLYNRQAFTNQTFKNHVQYLNVSVNKGICPTGWHLPTLDEWYYCGGTISNMYPCDGNGGARAAAAQSDWAFSDASPCAIGYDLSLNNASGFSALPAGGEMGSEIPGPHFGDATNFALVNNDAIVTWNYWCSGNIRGRCCYVYELAPVRCVKNENFVFATASVMDLTDSSAVCGGSILLNYGEPSDIVTERGVCWNITENPSAEDGHTIDGTGDGAFFSQLTGLTPGTTYYVRAYAVIDGETVYGNQITFTTYSLPAPPQP